MKITKLLGYKNLRCTNTELLKEKDELGHMSPVHNMLVKIFCIELNQLWRPLKQSLYMFRLSFLTTLNIYKDYFKGRQRLRKCEAKLYSCKLWPETEFALIYLSLSKLLCLYILKFCDQGVSWSSSCDELKNFAANVFLKLMIKSRTGICASIS